MKRIILFSLLVMVLIAVGCEEEIFLEDVKYIPVGEVEVMEKEIPATECAECLAGYYEECAEYEITEHQKMVFDAVDAQCCDKYCWDIKEECYNKNIDDYGNYRKCRKEAWFCEDNCNVLVANGAKNSDYDIIIYNNNCIKEPYIARWNTSKCIKTILVKEE